MCACACLLNPDRKILTTCFLEQCARGGEQRDVSQLRSSLSYVTFLRFCWSPGPGVMIPTHSSLWLWPDSVRLHFFCSTFHRGYHCSSSTYTPGLFLSMSPLKTRRRSRNLARETQRFMFKVRLVWRVRRHECRDWRDKGDNKSGRRPEFTKEDQNISPSAACSRLNELRWFPGKNRSRAEGK